LEALERQYGPAALTLLVERVPRRLLPHASLDRLKASASLDTISLDDGEELLLLIDHLLGEGTGRALECVGQELASRALNQGGVAKFGDLYGTVARLQAFLDHPFVDTPTQFELKRSDLGFTLVVGVVGRPRATRVLRHLAIGSVYAADRAAREGGGVKLSSEVVADRAAVHVHYQRTEPAPRQSSEPPPPSVRRPTQSVRPPSLSQEVERILGSHTREQPPRARRITPLRSPKRQSQPPSDPNAELTSEVQPVAPRVPSGRDISERTSEVQPVAAPASSKEASERRPSAPSQRRSSRG
jgi:hypothetical protein